MLEPTLNVLTWTSLVKAKEENSHFNGYFLINMTKYDFVLEKHF